MISHGSSWLTSSGSSRLHFTTETKFVQMTIATTFAKLSEKNAKALIFKMISHGSSWLYFTTENNHGQVTIATTFAKVFEKTI